MDKKYDRLAQQFAALGSDVYTVPLRFADIDRLCGGLPDSARRNRTWWANGSNTQAQAWREAGWHVDKVDLRAETVVFARGQVGGSYAARRLTGEPAARPATAVAGRGPEFGWVDGTARLAWHERGEVQLHEAQLRFPRLPRTPGLYRMDLTGGTLLRSRVYIGETRSLDQRMTNYRRPPPGAQTSIRIHALLAEHIGGGGIVRLATCEEGSVLMLGRERDADFSLKRERVLLEHAALVQEAEVGNCDIANL